jgi:uncharacterized spore protein YtfJ
MDVAEVLSQTRDSLTVKRVFGEPIERNGVTIVPVAKIAGGGGGGAGQDAEGEHGSGVGFGVHASPAGAYVIRGDEVTWEPAIDVTRIALFGQVLGLVAILTVRAVLLHWLKSRGNR